MAKHADKMKEKKVQKTPEPTQSVTWGSHPLARLRDDIDHAFEGFLQGWPRFSGWEAFRGSPGSHAGSYELMPRAELTAQGDAYEVAVELPGIDDKDVELSILDNMLTIKGEKKEEKEEKKKDYYLSERSYGTFRRSIRLPDDIDPEKMSAVMKNGVMTIAIQKTKGSPSRERQIPISKG